MDNPNRLALDLVDEAIDFADELGIGVRHTAGEAAVLDFGIDHPGGVEAGVLLAELATGGLATVQVTLDDVAGAALPAVEVSTDHPALSLLGCQSGGWTVTSDGATRELRGPGQLLRPDATVPGPDDGNGADFAVVVVEADAHPGEGLVRSVAEATGLPTSGVFVAAAPAGSVAGTVAAAARTASVALNRLAELSVDPGTVRTAAGSAPVPPTGGGEGAARARAAGAIAYGGRVHLRTETDVAGTDRLVYGGADTSPPSGPASGARDRLEGLLAPAQVTVDVIGGPTHVAGAVDQTVLAEELGV